MKIYTLILLITSFISNAAPVSYEFTFQGELLDNGSPATGKYDVYFGLFDEADESGVEYTSSYHENIQVTNGLIQASIDFGELPFLEEPGKNVWVEVEIRPNGDIEDFEVLSPRQKITVTPLAITALNVAKGSIQANSIAENAVTTSHISDNSIGSNEIDSKQIQERITGMCSTGFHIESINEDGSVKCATDNGWKLVNDELHSLHDTVLINTDSTIGSASFVVNSDNTNNYGGMFVNVDGNNSQKPFIGFATNNSPRAWIEFEEETDKLHFVINNNVFDNKMLSINDSGDVQIKGLKHNGSSHVPVSVDSSGNLVKSAGQVISIPPSAFQAEYVSQDKLNLYSTVGISHGNWGVVSAPVSLPHGVTVTQVNVHFYDASVSSNLKFTLNGNPIGDSVSGITLMERTTQSNPGNESISVNNVQNNVIDNLSYVYSVSAIADDNDANLWSNSLRVRGVSIVYQY